MKRVEKEKFIEKAVKSETSRRNEFGLVAFLP